jgi:catalase
MSNPSLSPGIARALDDLNGLHPGFRPAHAKGVMLTGTFTLPLPPAHLPVLLTYKPRPRR